MLLWDRGREYDMDHRKKKIGILTSQKAVNYGASLQMYALQKTVKELGAEAEIIDYDCPRISDCYQAFPLRVLVHPRLFWHAVLNYKEQSHRNQKFEQFEKKHMTFSEKLGKKALSHVADRYDAYIVGSDQVWNPLITGGDSAYFLDFVKDRQKKFAYAASFGVSSWPVGYPSAEKMFEDFRAISTHEKTGGGDCPYSDGKDATAFCERGPGLSAVTSDLAAFCETGHWAETISLHLRGREREAGRGVPHGC